MAGYRNRLPQLSGDLYLTDAGLETDLIFNHGIEIREFAAHTLLLNSEGRGAIDAYLADFLALANRYNTGFILDTPTWKAHMHWAADLGSTENELCEINIDAVRFVEKVRDRFPRNQKPIVLNGVIGPKGDAYAPEERLTPVEAQDYHSTQIGWLANTNVDMLTGMTITQSDEAIGLVRAAQKVGLPVVVSFTVETDGRLPTGQSLASAIRAVDAATASGAVYYMVNCAHPDHFFNQFDGDDWTHRIRGIRCNASRLSHEQLDACETLDDGDPLEFAMQYKSLIAQMPWLNIFGGCCGSDLRHVEQVIAAVSEIR